MQGRKVHMTNKACFLARRGTSHWRELLVGIENSSQFRAIWRRCFRQMSIAELYLKLSGLSIIAGTVQRSGLKWCVFPQRGHSGRVVSHPWHSFFVCHSSSYPTLLHEGSPPLHHAIVLRVLGGQRDSLLGSRLQKKTLILCPWHHKYGLQKSCI